MADADKRALSNFRKRRGIVKTTTNHVAKVPISAHQPSENLETSESAKVTAASPSTPSSGLHVSIKALGMPVLSLSHLLVQAHLTLWIVKMSAMK